MTYDGDGMAEKRFKVHSMIRGMDIGETMDLEVCEELIKKYGSSSDIDLLITNNGNNMTYKEVADLLNENEQLKQENSVFEGKDAKHYQRWVNQIKKYVEETNTDFTYDDDFIIKIALSYTLQSLRNGESLKRFQWDYKELQE